MSLQTSMNGLMTGLGSRLLALGAGGAGAVQLFRRTTSGSITVTQEMIDANFGWFVLRMCGGGAGGGSGFVSVNPMDTGSPALGGGGGELFDVPVQITLPGTYTVTIGAGGTGAAAVVSAATSAGVAGLPGSDGGDTTLVVGSRTYTAFGGQLGLGGILTTTSRAGGDSGGMSRLPPATHSLFQTGFLLYAGAGVSGTNADGGPGITGGASGGTDNNISTPARRGGSCLASGSLGGLAGAQLVGGTGPNRFGGGGAGASFGPGGNGGAAAENANASAGEDAAANTGAGGGGGGSVRRSSNTARTSGRGGNGGSGFFELWGAAA